MIQRQAVDSALLVPRARSTTPEADPARRPSHAGGGGGGGGGRPSVTGAALRAEPASGLSPEVLDNFIRSCAGCVYTRYHGTSLYMISYHIMHDIISYHVLC